MTAADDQNRQLLVKRLVDDAIAPYAKPPQAAELSIESSTRGG